MLTLSVQYVGLSFGTCEHYIVGERGRGSGRNSSILKSSFRILSSRNRISVWRSTLGRLPMLIILQTATICQVALPRPFLMCFRAACSALHLLFGETNQDWRQATAGHGHVMTISKGLLMFSKIALQPTLDYVYWDRRLFWFCHCLVVESPS